MSVKSITLATAAFCVLIGVAAAQPAATVHAQSAGPAPAAAKGEDHRNQIEILSNSATATTQTSGANGGIWRSTNGATAQTPAAPSSVTTAPQRAGADYFLELDGVEGEASAAPGVEPDELATNQARQAGLLLPAVQKVRDAAARTNGAAPGVEPDELVTQQAQQQGRGTGTLTLSSGGQAATPAPSAAPVAAAAEQPRQHQRGAFSLSIGGVTLGSGGVSVAAGDVNGDAQSAGRQHRPVRPIRESDHGSATPSRSVRTQPARASAPPRAAPARRGN